MTWPLYNGDQRTGITITEVHPQAWDAGAILAQQHAEIGDQEAAASLRARAAHAGAAALMATIAQLSTARGAQREQPQPPAAALDAPKPHPSATHLSLAKRTRRMFKHWYTEHGITGKGLVQQWKGSPGGVLHGQFDDGQAMIIRQVSRAADAHAEEWAGVLDTPREEPLSAREYAERLAGVPNLSELPTVLAPPSLTRIPALPRELESQPAASVPLGTLRYVKASKTVWLACADEWVAILQGAIPTKAPKSGGQLASEWKLTGSHAMSRRIASE